MDDIQDVSVDSLKERAKELECLYLVDEALSKGSVAEMLYDVSLVCPRGFRNVDACAVSICLDGQVYAAKNSDENSRDITADIIVNNMKRGIVKAAYPADLFPQDEKPFLAQEERLIKTIANRIAQTIYQTSADDAATSKSNWKTILSLLQKTDHRLLLYVCEKMIALLTQTKPSAANEIFEELGWAKYNPQHQENYPLEELPEVDAVRLSDRLFNTAGECLNDSQILDYLNLWIYQNKTYELIKLVDKKDIDAPSIAKALKQYTKSVQYNGKSSEATQRWLSVELIRRFLTDNPKLIENARKFVSVEAFSELLETYISSSKGSGSVGGKAAGFIVANQIIKAESLTNPQLQNISIPKTWYIASDEFANIVLDNAMDDLNKHKYLDIFEIRTSYPKIIQTIRSAQLSAKTISELNGVLEQSERVPLIVRSSSLLEDQMGSSFSGKYKSLFLANTGSKNERLKNLVDGILEVYASLFSPDSIQYRKEHNLLDCNEQMGVMIQEVVGCSVGPYYFPLLSGVAFNNNELLWSPRIKRGDGLVRMVMGLGTRAVDRVGDDFPILVSPGQPNLKINQLPQEVQRYSPRMIDVIDLEKKRFLTMPINRLIKDYGDIIPQIENLASVYKNELIKDFNRITTDFKTDDFVITFKGIIERTPFVKQIQTVLLLLKEKLGYAVDIEFAYDGTNLYVLQCRPQSMGRDNKPAAIPDNIPAKSKVFSANRYITNGRVAGIKTLIYIDPVEYAKIESYEALKKVGTAVSELNRMMPKKSFILLGPGRWGSRGDIKLGVSVSYSDINNTAMLIEIANKQSEFQPELSFGTHFFQDLVEENIKYLPLYPEEKENIFNYSFFNQNKNALRDILPSFADLEDVIKVINIDDNYTGKELVVLMNADLDTAVAFIDDSLRHGLPDMEGFTADEDYSGASDDDGWKWRHYMAEQIAAKMDLKQFGVKGIYLFGSTNNCTARLNSDIDLLIHVDGDREQRQKLDDWLGGWSFALSETNYLRTGYKSNGLLDVHYVTDEDIVNKTSFATRINSAYDPALPLRIRE